MSSIITKSSKKKDKRQVNENICNLEKEYRDCIKSRREKIRIARHIMMHQVLYLCSCPMKRVTCTIYSTWCIMLCLVTLILSLLLFIQSQYSFSKLHNFFVYLHQYRCWSKHMQWNNGRGFAPGTYNCFIHPLL